MADVVEGSHGVREADHGHILLQHLVACGDTQIEVSEHTDSALDCHPSGH